MSDRISAIRGLMGGNPEVFVMQALQTNPQFAAFVRANQGKSPEQIASENNIDLSTIRGLMGN